MGCRRYIGLLLHRLPMVDNFPNGSSSIHDTLSRWSGVETLSVHSEFLNFLSSQIRCEKKSQSFVKKPASKLFFSINQRQHTLRPDWIHYGDEAKIKFGSFSEMDHVRAAEESWKSWIDPDLNPSHFFWISGFGKFAFLIPPTNLWLAQLILLSYLWGVQHQTAMNHSRSLDSGWFCISIKDF